MDENKFFENKLWDIYSKAISEDVEVSSRFLSESMLSSAKTWLRQNARGADYTFYGGYDDCSRSMLIFNEHDKKKLITLLFVQPIFQKNKEDRLAKLSHSSYLGALLALGIKREVLGDIILTADKSAYIFVMREMTNFIMKELTKVGSFFVDVSLGDISKLREISDDREIVDCLVSSNRLDNIVGTLFVSKRTKAVELIKMGMVYINDVKTLKPDFKLKEGDKITVRGYGRAFLLEFKNKTKKDKDIITFSLQKHR